MYLFIYLFIFFFLFQKDSSFFNMFYNENNCPALPPWQAPAPALAHSLNRQTPHFLKPEMKRYGFFWDMGFRACMDRQIDEHVALTNPDWSIGIFLPIAKTNCPNREWAMTGRIFQALPNFCPHRQIDTMFALIYKM
jgi:hypothetical protein